LQLALFKQEKSFAELMDLLEHLILANWAALLKFKVSRIKKQIEKLQ
jgi:hypothetical protein